ncbi:MAG TPA: hypothetical protein ENO16_01415 [Chromatiales bacterium]|nr:hypothetical protein [Chromatiales bacterium]
MADVYADLGAWALAKLRATPAVTNLVMDDLLLEAGDLTAEALTEAQETRREAGETDRVLAVVVQDTGEQELVASCAVFIYDRYGYATIRTVREAVITALVNRPALLVRDACVNQVKYAGRSGHAIDRLLDLDFERVNFSGAIIAERDIYS